jgi:hypothetical protein
MDIIQLFLHMVIQEQEKVILCLEILIKMWIR